MDRTAWIVIILCVIGLLTWTWWTGKHQPPRPVPPALSPTPLPLATANASAAPLTPPSPTAAATATPAFAEKAEILRNDDVELRLTNRGGGIREASLLNQIAQGDKRVVINSKDQLPVGAMIEQPNAPKLDEFALSREADGSVKCERNADNVIVRKKFFFPPSKEKKDNFLAEMNVDLVNGGTQPYTNPGYFVALGSAAPIHPKDYSYYTRLVWCLDGKAKGVDVNWFGGGSGFFGIGQRAPQPFYQQDLANADWAAVSDQFFTTLIAPLTAKANGVWGRRFDISPEQKMYGLTGALRMSGFQLSPGQTYSARFEIWAGPKLYHRLAQLDHNEAEIMDFSVLMARPFSRSPPLLRSSSGRSKIKPTFRCGGCRS
jgi:YidC/Oxa1 family membrane protein insertase